MAGQLSGFSKDAIYSQDYGLGKQFSETKEENNLNGSLILAT